MKLVRRLSWLPSWMLLLVLSSVIDPRRDGLPPLTRLGFGARLTRISMSKRALRRSLVGETLSTLSARVCASTSALACCAGLDLSISGLVGTPWALRTSAQASQMDSSEIAFATVTVGVALSVGSATEPARAMSVKGKRHTMSDNSAESYRNLVIPLSQECVRLYVLGLAGGSSVPG